MEQPVILDGMRTPFGNFGGSLQDFKPSELSAHTISAAMNRCNIDANQIQHVFVGNVLQSGGEDGYLARHAALRAGINLRTPALTVNRLCGSGLEAVIQAAQTIMLGHGDVCVAAGVEVMSRLPHVSRVRGRSVLGHIEMEDTVLAGLYDTVGGASMGETAENLALDYDISREKQDEWAYISQERAEKAKEAGLLAEEIVPVEVFEGDFVDDEFIRGAKSKNKLPQLRPAFKKDGTVTAGNASGINDGASAMLVASESYAKKQGLKPLAKIKSYATAGCRPERMGLGPVYAIPIALERAGLELNQIDLIEVNEAFAAQFLAVQQELELNREITNVNGGAIAIGHPLGASGNRVLLTLVREMHRRRVRYGLASLCIGGGQGIAMIVERVE